MKNQLVCNINYFLYTRFIFGYYHDFQTSKPVRWLARCYCFLICTSIIYCYNNLKDVQVYPDNLMKVLSLEYFLYMLISLLKSNHYLVEFYKKMPLIEKNKISYKQMNVCLFLYICMLYFVRFCGFLKTLILHTNVSVTQQLFTFSDLILWFAISMGRLPLLFVFALLYNRVRLMRQKLESNNFVCRTQGNDHPQRYIQIFEVIMNGLKETNNSLKAQVFVFGVFSIAYYLYGALYAINLLKEFDLKLSIKLEILWFMVELTISSSPLVVSAILADLVAMEIKEMLGIIVERQIACKNERDGAEIQKLFQLMTNHPFEYNLLYLAELNVRNLLTFISFSFTTLIAIIQIKNWSE